MSDTVSTQTIAESFAAVADNEYGFNDDTAAEIKADLDRIAVGLNSGADVSALTVEQAIEVHRAYIDEKNVEDDIRSVGGEQ
jgi:hypothetical protein